MKSTNFPPKKKLTLKSILEWGAWVLGSWRSPSSSFHSRDGWYFFPWKVRKEGLLEDETIVNAKKKEVWKWVSQNGYEAKMAKNTRIWKDIEGDEWTKVKKVRKVFFLEKKWCREGENPSGRRKWIVTMEENGRKKREKKKIKIKEKTSKWGPNSPPHLYQWPELLCQLRFD